MRRRARKQCAGGGGVQALPVLGVATRVLPLWLAWLLVVVLGRLVCRLAQRLPPVVRLVRCLRARSTPRRRTC